MPSMCIVEIWSRQTYAWSIYLFWHLTGDSMQCLATYFMKGMASRITKSWPGLHKALNSMHLQPSITHLVSSWQVFYNLLPYLKFAFKAAHLSILESMEKEKVVHNLFGCVRTSSNPESTRRKKFCNKPRRY